MRSNAGMANRQGDVDLRFPQVSAPSYHALRLAWLGCRIIEVTGRRLVRAVAAEWSVPTSQNRSALSQRGAGIDFRDQY